MTHHGQPYRIEDRGYRTECWTWTLSCNAQGYAQRNVGGGVVKRMHKVMWEALNDPVPDGLELDHLCEHRDCVNPGHLEPVTHAVNCARSFANGKLTPAQVHEIRRERAGGALLRELAVRFGVGLTTVHAAVSGQNWSRL